MAQQISTPHFWSEFFNASIWDTRQACVRILDYYPDTESITEDLEGSGTEATMHDHMDIDNGGGYTDNSAALNSILIDSEMVSGVLINIIRELVGEGWVISAPNSDVVKGLKRLTPANHTGFAPGVKWYTDPPSNLVTYPTEESVQGSVKIDPREIATEAIEDEEEGERILIPLKHQLEKDTPPQKDGRRQCSLAIEWPIDHAHWVRIDEGGTHDA